MDEIVAALEQVTEKLYPGRNCRVGLGEVAYATPNKQSARLIGTNEIPFIHARGATREQALVNLMLTIGYAVAESRMREALARREPFIEWTMP